MFVAEQAAEVRTLDNLTTHNISGDMFVNQIADLDSLLKAAWQQQQAGDYESSFKTLEDFEAVLGSADDDTRLIRYEYLKLRAADELGRFTIVQADRIVEHKKVLKDKTNLAEIYFRAARFKHKYDRIKSAKQYLKKAKKFVKNEPEWADDIAKLDAILNPKIEMKPEDYKIDVGDKAGFSVLANNGTYGGSVFFAPGRFGKDSFIFKAMLGDLKGDFYRGGIIVAKSIGHYMVRDWKVEGDFIFMESQKVNSLEHYGPIKETMAHSAGVRVKLPFSYLEARGGQTGLIFGKKVNYVHKADGSHEFKDELSRIFAESVIEAYGREIADGSDVSMELFSHTCGCGGNGFFSFGAGIREIPIIPKLGMMLDWAGISYERFARGGQEMSVDISSVHSAYDQMGEALSPKLVSNDTWLRSEASLIQNKKLNLAVMYNRLLSEDIKKEKGVSFVMDLMKANRLKEEFGVNLIYQPASTNRVLFFGHYINQLDDNSNRHHHFRLGMSYVLPGGD